MKENNPCRVVATDSECIHDMHNYVIFLVFAPSHKIHALISILQYSVCACLLGFVYALHVCMHALKHITPKNAMIYECCMEVRTLH